VPRRASQLRRPRERMIDDTEAGAVFAIAVP
jgi:hypothetical protein